MHSADITRYDSVRISRDDKMAIDFLSPAFEGGKRACSSSSTDCWMGHDAIMNPLIRRGERGVESNDRRRGLLQRMVWRGLSAPA